ncbi:hypothetical protein CURTO8I2_220296 [Curtobacterium sp. 8I-2]|nr:hypothetical protein CURTO8I2_220296 [Curtobacterium sp. 8I-2]
MAAGTVADRRRRTRRALTLRRHPGRPVPGARAASRLEARPDERHPPEVLGAVGSAPPHDDDPGVLGVGTEDRQGQRTARVEATHRERWAVAVAQMGEGEPVDRLGAGVDEVVPARCVRSVDGERDGVRGWWVVHGGNVRGRVRRRDPGCGHEDRGLWRGPPVRAFVRGSTPAGQEP